MHRAAPAAGRYPGHAPDVHGAEAEEPRHPPRALRQHRSASTRQVPKDPTCPVSKPAGSHGTRTAAASPIRHLSPVLKHTLMKAQALHLWLGLRLNCKLPWEKCTQILHFAALLPVFWAAEGRAPRARMVRPVPSVNPTEWPRLALGRLRVLWHLWTTRRTEDPALNYVQFIGQFLRGPGF